MRRGCVFLNDGIRTALVTGASRGIGAECARHLAQDGYRVIINYKSSEDRAQALAEEIGGTAACADVADSAAMQELLDLYKPDVLVCNAGISVSGVIQDVTDASWQRLIDVNISGVFYACRAAVPHMVRRGHGRIITMSSVWGMTGASCESAYSATKAAVIGLTKALAKELGPSGITVNCIAPGVIDTEMNAVYSEAELAALAEQTPIPRLGTPRDIASLVSFLASDGAEFITGQVISSDGGFAV